jgi:tight adherence protein B
MKKAVVLGVLITAMMAAPAYADHGLEIIEVDVTEHPQIAITVSVPDSLSGTEVPADSFTLIENGYAMAAGVWTFSEEPLDVVLIMDTSGSMAGEPLADARLAALGFLDRLPDGARVAVVSSGGLAEVMHPLSNDRATAAAALESLESGGETALYDAVIAGAVLLPPDGPRAAIVVLSDGGDTVSAATLGDAVNALRDASGAETVVVALQTEESDQAALAAIAAAGGGSLVAVVEADSLVDAFVGIADDLTGRYRLVYLTRETGETDLAVVLAYGEVTSEARITLELPAPVESVTLPAPEPAAAAAPVAPNVSTPAVVAAPSLLRQPWTMPAGVAAVLVGAVAVMGLLLSRERSTFSFRERWKMRKEQRDGNLVSSLARRAEEVTDRVLKARDQGRIERDLDRAGIALRPGEFVVLSASLGIAAVAGCLVVFGPATALLIGVASMAMPRVILRVLMGRRRAAFADQFGGVLQIMSGSLRAGYGLMQAVATVAEEASMPTGKEFSRVAVENRLGRTVEESLRSMADRMDNEDLRWVVEAIDIQYEVGGDLAEVLDNVAETIRDRDQIRRQVKALSAEGRMSAVILVLMPFALALAMSVVSPDYLAELTGTTVGRIMIGGALVMIGVGAMWIRRIVKVVF